MNTPLAVIEDYEPIGTITRPVIDEAWIKENTEPFVPYHAMLQNEIEALREEVKTLRSQLLFPNNEPKFLGFPIRHHDASDDDCLRTTYEAYILGQWREVVTCGLRFDKKEAVESICNILKMEAGV